MKYFLTDIVTSLLASFLILQKAWLIFIHIYIKGRDYQCLHVWIMAQVMYAIFLLL